MPHPRPDIQNNSDNHACPVCDKDDIIQDILAEIDLIKQRLAYYAVPKLADAVSRYRI